MVLIAACLSLSGCGRSGDRDDARAPAKVLLQLCDLHRQRSYKDMEPLIEPSRSAIVIDTLMQMDQLLQAADLLQVTAELRIGPVAATACDLRHMADYLGPFSRRVQIVSTRMEVDRAFVAYQVAQRVPLERAEVRRMGERWCYVPDEPDLQLPLLLARLTERLAALRRDVEAGTCNEQTFLAEFARTVMVPLQSHLEEVARRRRQEGRLAATPPS